MNRSVLARQMFANGGQAVPNEYKGFSRLPEQVQMKMDPVAAKKYAEGGSVNTQDLQAQADRMGITLRELLALMVSPPFAPSGNMAGPEATMMRPNETYSEVKPMAMGGDPAMAQGVGSMMPPPPAMPEGQGMAEQAMDPQVLEGLLNEASQSIGDLDQAEDYETVINSIRGDDAPISARYEELASVVGEEDAAQTPESVLALTQPAIMMGAVDQGIGGLAAEEMTEPVQGAMAQGIMSNVAPPPPPAGMGGPPPVNFNQGGLVRRGDNQPVKMMQAGGDPLQTAFESRLPIYEGILGDPTAQLEEQKKLTKANMLFDIANTALAFAAPMQGETPGMSGAERLAMAARTTQLPQTIGARAQSQLDAEKAAKAQQQQMRLSALSAAEADVTAQAKAKADAALQELKGQQKLAEIETSSRLDLGVKSKVEELRQAGRLDIQNLKGYQNMSLEELKQAGAISLEDFRQANREIQEGVVQENRLAIENLKATGRTADAVLANKLEQDNIVLRGNIELGKMGVANEYELEKLELTQGFDRELNNTNNALKEKLSGLDRELSERRLKLDTIKAEVDREQGERKLELQAEANAMQADLNAFTMNYKTDKLDLERAAARLTRLGTSTEARITTLLSDPESLANYATGMMSKEDTLEFNQAIAYYNAPKQVWNEKEKRFVLSPGNPLSKELMASIQLRDNSGLTVPNIKLDTIKTPAMTDESKTEIKSAITEGLPDGALEAAFGSLPLAKSVANDLVEAFSFGKVGAPYKVSKDAITAAETLNTRTVQVFQKSADLRESVTQLNLLKDRTPEAAAFFTGPNKAASKIKAVVGMIRDEKVLLEKYLESDQYPMGSKEYMDATTALDKLNQLEAGYGVFSKAYSTIADNKMKALQQIIKKK